MKRLPILDKLDEDLAQSQKELQVDIPKAILTAREHGDLSETAEFKAAKERQMLLEARVSLLQKRISDIMSINVNQIPKARSGLTIQGPRPEPGTESGAYHARTRNQGRMMREAHVVPVEVCSYADHQ